jgi:2-amino-4-hydroxy-6-hydroxymethyldihydropteridine diphosphokinase
MPIAYLGLGSNLGDRAANLWEAVRKLGTLADTQVLGVSSLFETEPVGPVVQPNFLNAAVRIHTLRSPLDLLHDLKRLETALGRAASERWGPRVIDLDILVYGQDTLDTPELTVPHRELWRRRFVLEPLLEVVDDQVLAATARRALAGLAATPRVWAYRPIDRVGPWH